MVLKSGEEDEPRGGGERGASRWPRQGVGFDGFK